MCICVRKPAVRACVCQYHDLCVHVLCVCVCVCTCIVCVCVHVLCVCVYMCCVCVCVCVCVHVLCVCVESPNVLLFRWDELFTRTGITEGKGQRISLSIAMLISVCERVCV